MERKSKLFAALILTLLLMLVTGIPVSAAASPGTVKLTKISATDYNKINIKWKKTSGATNYLVYYKKAGTSKWTKIKTLDSTKSSYTHISSSKYPIVVGQKYQYTVKAYNKKTKKSGSYNTKGLTTNTIPQTVKMASAKLNSSGTVNVSWNKANGADKYVLFYKVKTDDFTTNWTKLTTLSSSVTSYTVKSPFQNASNFYTVKSYNSSSNVYGKYDTNGVNVFVKTSGSGSDGKDDGKDDDVWDDSDVTPTPTPVNPEEMANEVIRLTNIERVKAGKPTLTYNAGLQKAAMLRAKEISTKFSHERPNGEDSSTALYEFGVGYSSGENIAAGYKTPEAVVKGWMNSSGHRLALLYTGNLYIGVGFYQDSTGRYYWVQEFAKGDPDSKGTVVFDANGGVGGTTYNLPYGQRIYLKDVPIPQRAGYKFDGWISEYNEDLTCTSAGSSTKTFFAKWIPIN